MHALAQRARGTVGVTRQHDHGVRGRSIRGIDAGVGADEAVMGDADQHAASGADQLARLVEDDLDVSRVLAVLAGELPRPLPRRHVGERSDAPFGLGERLVCDYQHVTGPELELAVGPFHNQRRQVGAALDLGESCERRRGEHPPIRSGCGASG